MNTEIKVNKEINRIPRVSVAHQITLKYRNPYMPVVVHFEIQFMRTSVDSPFNFISWAIRNSLSDYAYSM